MVANNSSYIIHERTRQYGFIIPKEKAATKCRALPNLCADSHIVNDFGDWEVRGKIRIDNSTATRNKRSLEKGSYKTIGV